MSDGYGQMPRLFYILNLLEGNSKGLTVPEMHSRVNQLFKITKRQIYRDLDALTAAGFPLIEENSESLQSQAKLWRLDSRLRISKSLVLTPRELVALYLAKSALQSLRGSSLFKDLTLAFKKIEATLGAKCLEYFQELKVGIHFEQNPSWGSDLDSDVIDTIRASCEQKQVLSVVYRSLNSSSERKRKLGSHFIYFAKNSAYLIAEDLEIGQIKIFSISRMKKALLVDQEYKSKTVEPNEFFNSAFGVYRGERVESITLIFSSSVVEYVGRAQWHFTQKNLLLDDGRLEMQMNVAITDELVQWLLGFGANVSILTPKTLRDQVISEAQKILKLYEEKNAA